MTFGTSYRSAIFYPSDEQKQVAEDTIADVDASGLWPGKVLTEVAPSGEFWEAEPEHQDYLENIPYGYTCHFVSAGLEASSAREDHPKRRERGRVALTGGIVVTRGTKVGRTVLALARTVNEEVSMLFVGIARFRPNSQNEHDALRSAFTDHLAQPQTRDQSLPAPSWTTRAKDVGSL